MQPQTPFWMGETGEYQNEVWECVQGDAFAAYVQLFCDCPTLVDITGWQFMFEVKESLDPNDPNILGSVLWTETNGGRGITALVVVPKVTAMIPDGRYAFDLKYRTPSQLVKTIRRGEWLSLPTAELELSYNQEVPPAGGGWPSLPGLPPTGYYALVVPQSHRQGYG